MTAFTEFAHAFGERDGDPDRTVATWAMLIFRGWTLAVGPPASEPPGVEHGAWLAWTVDHAGYASRLERVGRWVPDLLVERGLATVEPEPRIRSAFGDLRPLALTERGVEVARARAVEHEVAGRPGCP